MDTTVFENEVVKKLRLRFMAFSWYATAKRKSRRLVSWGAKGALQTGK